jgi:hypothetical protein
MKTNIVVSFLVAIMVAGGCSEKKYTIVEVENPAFHENTAFNRSEDLRSPKFERLKTKYQLDTLFKGEEDEFQRILLIRNWIKSVIKIDDFGDPYPGDGEVEGILDAALQGTGFHCGHYMKVQNGAMNAYGYITRTLGAGPGEEGGRDGHHGVNEVWLNSYQKWFLSDAKYNHHFEKNGIPLSALEIRDEDDYFKNNTWIWDGKPHWAYEKPEFMIREPNRNAIEWTPNTIQSQVKIEGKIASINLTSQTPNFREYQMKATSSEDWRKIENPFDLTLTENAYDLSFRAVNLAHVTGPEHQIKIRFE